MPKTGIAPPDLPTSNVDLIEKLKRHKIKAHFVPYEKLRYIDDLEDVLPMVLLFQAHWPVGHWVTLWRNKSGLHYFDPTGHVPDALNKTNYDHPKGRQAMGASYTYLTALIFKDLEDHDEVALDYNDVKLRVRGLIAVDLIVVCVSGVAR